MAKGKVENNGWKKLGSTDREFFQPWRFPQIIEGILSSTKMKKGKFKGIDVTIQRVDGVAVQMGGGAKSQFFEFFNGRKIGERVRVVYKGGQFEGGLPLKKGLTFKTYKEWSKFKKKKDFYPSYDFYAK